MDVLAREDLAFPQSLPEFQRIFPDDAACAAYLEKARWNGGFACPRCGVVAEPFRFEARPGVLRCRACRKDASLTAGTVMETQSHAVVDLVLGGLLDRQPNAGNVGRPISTATRSVAL